ncbi:membrane-associated protein, putative [Bodo saltans]|uniref:Membrane-associated protein, putative n=1 Tax=Bodo saltans TaxID=75058 RepID=A0A0S4KIU9_BODSA|nr:membrane-associated protein, putative [Bodo saltans]|eukprot:CUI14503.1 membrane-associated protein, putative [Bodo saltans]
MNAFIVVCVLGLLASLAAAADPFIPTSGWTIYLEGVRAAPWLPRSRKNSRWDPSPHPTD